MKLYTRSGDDGTTGLFGGGRVTKDHPRVDAYGQVDECNACLGLAAAAIGAANSAGSPSSTDAALGERFQVILQSLQSRMFDLGADLATPADSKHESKVDRITAEHVSEAERWIDEVDAQNTPITAFILPGGTELAARLHLARTISRRAERAMVQLAKDEPVNPQAIKYINRVSDLLFAMARLANKMAGLPDVMWKG